MNIFVLSRDPREAARMMNDRHVVKMVLESLQLLSTALHCHSLPAPYRKTHVNHPCSLWVRERAGNYAWLYEHADALGKEYTIRYGKVHKSHALLSTIPNTIPAPEGMTEFANVTPYRDMDVVDAYRTLYMVEKRHIATWKTNPPHWWK